MEELDRAVVKELLDCAANGATPSQLLRIVIDMLELREGDRMDAVQYLRETFNLEFIDANAFWASTFFRGGTLTDDEIDALLKPLFKRRRSAIARYKK